jgi:glycosyltransferase involved in cell wall biosynthesis
MVTGAYFPEVSSAGVQCQTLARALKGRADVRVLTTAVDPGLPHDDEVDGVPVARVHIDVTSARSKARATRRMLAELARLMPHADLVHVHGVSSKNVIVTLAAKWFTKPLVLSLHTAGFDEPAAVRAQGRLAWWAFRSADLYLSVSPALVEAFQRTGPPGRSVHLVPNGIDTDRFRPATAAERDALRRRFGFPADRPVVAFVGFFSHDKQPRTLFEAWMRINTDERGWNAEKSSRIDSTLLFVGATESPYFEVDAQLAAAMRSDAARLGIADRLVFAGVTHDVPDYLRASDLFVLPSRREGLPVALLEAMACGLPCVASRLPATDGIITDGRNGVLVAPGDVAAFADAMAALLGDPARAAALGAAARATVVERFDASHVADRWMAAYQVVTP